MGLDIWQLAFFIMILYEGGKKRKTILYEKKEEQLGPEILQGK